MARRINLLPQTERIRTTTDFGMLAIVVLGIVIIFALGLGYYTLNGRLDAEREELATVQRQVAELQSQVSALDEFARLSAQREAIEARVQSIYAGRTLTAGLLDSISLVIPAEAWFQSLDLTTPDPGAGQSDKQKASTTANAEGELSLEGNTYGYEGVAQVLVRLQLVPGLRDVTLVSAGEPLGETDPTKDVRGFSVTATVVNNQSPDTPLPVSQVETEAP